MTKKISLLLVILCMMVCAPSLSAKDKDGGVPDYNIEGAGNASTGYYLVNVTVIKKDKKVSDNELKRAAVHGVLFKGFNNPSARGSQKPLAGSIANEGQHHDFYCEFFGEGGNATSYANVIEGSRSIKKIDKQYHTTATVEVSKETLLRYLRDAGIVKGLNSIF